MTGIARAVLVGCAVAVGNIEETSEEGPMSSRQLESPITTNGSHRAVAVPAPSLDTSAAPGAQAGAEVVLEELLVEDVSIDGMCGVY